MSHELSYDADADFILLRVQGRVTLDRVRELALEVASLCAATGCNRLLNDMTAATFDVSAEDLYDSPTVMEQSNISPSLKRALVVPDSFEVAPVLEKITRHREHDLRVFTNLETAKLWLGAP